MKRIIITVLFLAVAAIIFLLLLRRTETVSGGNFKVNPEKGITRVELRKERSKVVLELKKDEWYLNGSEKARWAAVSFLISTLQGMELKSPVSHDVLNSLSSKSTGNPVFVKVFSGRRKVRSLMVYHYNDVNYSSIVRKNRRSTPYLVYLPGYEFDPAAAFTAEEDFWKPFTIFELMPSAIKEITMDYPAEPLKSFSIFSEKGKIVLKGDNNFDTLAVKRYLSYFVNVPFESLVTGIKASEEHAIISSVPVFSLTVLTNDGKQYKLNGWKKMRAEDGEPDTDRLWGRLNNGKVFVMRYFDVDPLLKKRSYFLDGK